MSWRWRKKRSVTYFGLDGHMFNRCKWDTSRRPLDSSCCSWRNLKRRRALIWDELWTCTGICMCFWPFPLDSSRQLQLVQLTHSASPFILGRVCPFVICRSLSLDSLHSSLNHLNLHPFFSPRMNFLFSRLLLFYSFSLYPFTCLLLYLVLLVKCAFSSSSQAATGERSYNSLLLTWLDSLGVTWFIH